MSVDYDLLRSFIAAAEAPTFREAAKRRAVTQSAVSHQIRTLEGQLGVSLFERVGRSNRLTGAGDRLYQATVNAFSEIDTALEGVQEADSPMSGTVRIGAVGEFCRRWLRPRLPELMHRYPDMRLMIATRSEQSGIDEALLSGDLDIAVLFSSPTRDGVRCAPIYQEKIIAVASPAYLEQCMPLTHIDDLRMCDFVGSSVDLLIPWWREIFGATSKVPEPRCDLRDMQEMLRLARLGLGITVVPTFMLRDELAVSELVQVKLDQIPEAKSSVLYKQVSLAWRHKSSAARRVERVCEVLLSRDMEDASSDSLAP